jgi:7-carboxy-7-deazaguanine synthase
VIELAETYVTISGEAPIIGDPVLIVRCAGCNLACAYCDSKYAGEITTRVSEEELAKTIVRSKRDFASLKVLVTGGEPLLGERQRKIVSIVESLPEVKFYIETNGSISIENTGLSNCSYVVDIKTPSSGHEHSFVMENLSRLRPALDCIKIVLSESDLPWVIETVATVRRINRDLPIFLSPQWDGIELPRLADFILSHKLPVSMSIQLHKLIWGKDAKGV